MKELLTNWLKNLNYRSKMKKVNLAIVGATGLVGSTFLKVLEEKKLKFKNIYLYASSRSAGRKIKFMGKMREIIELKEENIKGKDIDYALFSAGGSISKEYAPMFVKYGAVVIDNSSAWRKEQDVPLIVPQVNMEESLKHKGIISNPNCSTIQCMLPLKVLHDMYGLKSVNYVTFQATSGSGMKGLRDLNITKNGEKPEFYPHPIYNNCLPHIGNFLGNGYSEEEIKMVKETQKILGLPNLAVNATCVRVPIENSHSIEIEAEFEKEVDLKESRKALDESGVVVLDNPNKNVYPLATLATGKDEIFVGRIRQDIYNPKVLHFFCVADNIRKGAATNAIEILEELLKK